MAIKLHYDPRSPPARCVLMALKALALEFEENIIDLAKGEQKSPEFLSVNPRGKVPALSDGDYCIAESRAIACYLCNQYESATKTNKLYPSDAKGRGKVDQMLYVSENISDMVVGYVNLPGVIFRGEKPKEDKLPEVVKALELTKKALTENDNAFVAGKHFTLADIFMAMPFYSMHSVTAADVNPMKDFPEVRAWFDKINAMPCFNGSNSGGTKLADAYKRSLEGKGTGFV